MPDRGILIFAYDGSFDGFLSGVFDAFLMKVLPADMVVFDDLEPSLLPIHYVETNLEHAKRVLFGIDAKLGEMGMYLTERGFLFDGEGKENAIMYFLWKAFKEKTSIAKNIGDEEVSRVFKMCTAVNNEAEKHRQFTRFKDYNGALVAEIHPKHFVLPLIKPFFCGRIKNEHFMIFDAEHGAALVHSPGKTGIIPVENLEIPTDAEDGFYSELWRSYYRHIAIAERYNPRCRNTHMPKRFWKSLPEVFEETEGSFVPKLSFGGSKGIAENLKKESQNRLENREKRLIIEGET